MNIKNSKLTLLSAAAAALVFATAPAGAQLPYTWDADNGTGGNQDGGGNWEVGQPNWDADGTPDQNWADTNDATIGVGSGAAGTITVTGTVNPGAVTLADPGSGSYTLGGTGTLTATGKLNKNSTGTSTLGGTTSFTFGGIDNNSDHLVIETEVINQDGKILTGERAINGGHIEITGSGSMTSGGAQIFCYSDITLRDNASLGWFGHGNFELDDGVGSPELNTLTIMDNATFTVDRDGASNGYTGTGGIATDGFGGFTYGLEWNQYSTATIDQQGGTVNLTNPLDGVNPWGPGLVLAHNATGGSDHVDNRYNLSGGVLNVSSVAGLGPAPTGPTLAAGGTAEGNGLAPIFNFNGGTMRASQSDSTELSDVTNGWHRFMINMWHAYVQAGGAIIDTQGFTNSIDQALEHDPALGGTPDGGLTKLGTGTLTLMQPNTYTGDTTVSDGVLEVQHASLDDGSSVSIAPGASMFLNFSGLDSITGLTLGGVSQGSGIYNASSHPAFFTGIGSLQIGDTTLVIAPSGIDFLLTWDSSPGSSYNVLGAPGLPPANPFPWGIYDGNSGILNNADEGTGEDDGDSAKTTVKVDRPPGSDFYFAIAGFPTPEQCAFEDDFDGADMGWVAAGTVGDGPTNWEEGTPGAPGPATANSGTDCWGTNLTADYGENADVTLTSPSIDLTSATTAELRFMEWSSIDNTGIGGDDTGSIEILDADNSDALLATIRSNTSDTTGWEPAALDLFSYLGGNIKVRFRLVTSNDGFVAPGWYIDDVKVAFTP